MSIGIPNLCIKHLPSDFEKQDLLLLFSFYGKIKSAKVMFDLKTGKSKEFGFVCFESHLSAAYAKDKLNGKWISKNNLQPFNYKSDPSSKKIIVCFAKSEANKEIISNELLVSSLPLFYCKKDIHYLFSQYGEVTSINMIIDNKRQTYHGKAIITYKTNEEAKNALNGLNNIKIPNNAWPLYIRFNKCKSEHIVSKKSNKFSVNEITNHHEIDAQNKINDDYFYKDPELELFMFKMLVNEI